MGHVFYMEKGRTHTAPIIGDPHTLLLLHGEQIMDSSPYRVPIQNSGVTVSPTQSKFGGKALRFNGGSNLSISNEKLKTLMSGDCTIEWWEFRENSAGCTFSLCPVETARYASQMLFKPASDTIWSSSDGTDFDEFYNVAIQAAPLNKWVHNAMVKTGQQIRFYYDGKMILNLTASYPYEAGNGDLLIGRRLWPSGPAFFTGYIDEFRISNVARWTSDFTPPTAPYSS